MEPDSSHEPDERAAESVPAAVPPPEATVPAVRPGSGVAVEVLSAALSSALLFALFLFLPLAGAVALAFAGVPLVRVAHRRGLRAGILGAVIAAGLLVGIGAAAGGASDGVAGGLLAAVAIGLPVLCAGLVRRGAPSSAAFLVLAAVGFAVLVGALLVREQAAGARPVAEEIAAAFDAMTPMTGASTAKGVDPETAARVAAFLKRSKEFAQVFWPGLVGASWVLAAAVAFYAGAMAARPASSAERVRFEELRVPAPAVALFVAAGAASALLTGPARAISGDLLLPLVALYFLTGLSIICHFARRWFRARILRGSLYAMVVYIFPLNVGVGLLGLFDWYADFRRRGQKA